MNAALPSPEIAGTTTPVPPATRPSLDELAPFKREAQIVRELAFPSALHEVLKLGQFTSPPGTKTYLDEMIRDCGQPSDPMERMLVQQCVLAHHQIASLQVKSASAKSLAETKVYTGATCQLLAEFRRLTLALKEYRDGRPVQHVTVVKQQNVAQHQQVAFMEGPPGSPRTGGTPEKSPRDTELGSKERLNHVPNQFIPQLQSSSCRQEERLPAAGVHARWAGTTAPSCADDEALELLDGP